MKWSPEAVAWACKTMEVYATLDARVEAIMTRAVEESARAHVDLPAYDAAGPLETRALYIAAASRIAVLEKERADTLEVGGRLAESLTITESQRDAAQAEAEALKSRVALLEAQNHEARERLEKRTGELKEHLEAEREAVRELTRRAQLAEARAADATKDADSWKKTAQMYADAWTRELGGASALIPKSHQIDALVLTTRKLREDLSAVRAKLEECALALADRTQALVAAVAEKDTALSALAETQERIRLLTAAGAQLSARVDQLQDGTSPQLPPDFSLPHSPLQEAVLEVLESVKKLATVVNAQLPREGA